MSRFMRIEPIFPTAYSSLWPNLPDSTNYGEKKIEVCEKAFPANVICKVCGTVIEPCMIFVFSCRHFYHGYCAQRIAHMKIRNIPCPKCTNNIPKQDWIRLSNLPTRAPLGYNARFVPE